MSYLSMMEARLPPGFRFHPRDEELICDYLTNKITGDDSIGNFYGCPTMIDVDLNKCEPWDLPEMACVGGKEWYFYSLRDRKYATGQRTNRATMSGYWKATGKDRHIYRRGVLVGMRKTLVFYQGRAPKGRKTDWVMHEFRMEVSDGSGGDLSKLSSKEDWVLCRVFYKSRGLSSKPISMMMDTTNYQDRRSSSSLATHITFGQTPMSLEGYEQVPCFSNPIHASMTPAAAMPGPPPAALSSIIMPFKSHQAQHVVGGLPDLSSGLNQLNQLDCDKKVIRAFLNHLTKMEGNQKSGDPPTSMEGEGSIDNYLSVNGLSSMW